MISRLYNINGVLVRKYTTKYSIKWDKPSRSKIQFRTKQFLKKYWIACQVFEEFPVFGTKMRVDILNLSKNIAVEINGPQHKEYNKFFHNGSLENFHKSLRRDALKYKWLQRNNIDLIEIEKEDISKLSPEYIYDNFEIEI
jgi:hypothetical protein